MNLLNLTSESGDTTTSIKIDNSAENARDFILETSHDNVVPDRLTIQASNTSGMLEINGVRLAGLSLKLFLDFIEPLK